MQKQSVTQFDLDCTLHQAQILDLISSQGSQFSTVDFIL